MAVNPFRWGKSTTSETDLYSETIFTSRAPSKISETQAIRIPAVKSSIELISSSIAQLPIYLYVQVDTTDTQKVIDDEREVALNRNANRHLTSQSLKKLIVKDYLLHGIAYVLKRGNELHYLEAKNMREEVYTEDGITVSSKKFIYEGMKTVELGEEEVLVVDNSTNGLLADSAETFEIALAQQDINSSILQNGGLPTGVLKSASRLTENAISRLRESWSNLYGGPKKAGKTIILEEGLDYQQLQLNLEQLQMVESQKNVVSEIARVFNLPEALINSDANKYASLAQQNTQFYQSTLSPIITSIETSLSNALLSEAEKRTGYFFRFDTSEILRTTEKEKIEIISKGFNDGLYSYNESRTKLDLPKVEEDFRLLGIGNVQVFESGRYEYLNLGPAEQTEGGNIIENGSSKSLNGTEA